MENYDYLHGAAALLPWIPILPLFSIMVLTTFSSFHELKRESSNTNLKALKAAQLMTSLI